MVVEKQQILYGSDVVAPTIEIPLSRTLKSDTCVNLVRSAKSRLVTSVFSARSTLFDSPSEIVGVNLGYSCLTVKSKYVSG